MPESGDARARKRLGALLTQRRVELDPRFRNRRVFSRECGIHYRLVQDIENAARGNFDDSTRAFIAVTYGWTPDSVDRVLDGGDPVPAPGTPGAAGPAYGDPNLQQIWELNLPEKVRLGMIALARDMREADENGNGAERPA